LLEFSTYALASRLSASLIEATVTKVATVLEILGQTRLA
jgi:hypothetical protein